MNAQTADTIIARALALRDADQPERAIAPLHIAIARDRDNARLWQTLGVVCRALERSADAVQAFEHAARLVPTDPKAAHGVAQATLEAGRPAAWLFDRARALAPNDASILIGRSAAQLAEGQGDAAIRDLDALVAASPLWLEGQAALARLRWMMGDDRDFVAGYVRALRAHPESAPLWLALIDTLMQVDHYASAHAVIGRARQLGMVGARIDGLTARCLSELGDVSAADAAFAKLTGSHDIAIAEAHVRHLLRSGRPDRVVARAESHLADPQAARLWPYLSLAWRVLGDTRAQWLESEGDKIAVIDLADRVPDLGELAARLRQLHQARRDPLGQSVRAGTQTDGPLFANAASEIQAVRAAVLEAVAAYVAALPTIDRRHPMHRAAGRPLRFAGSWSVRLTGAGHHSPHVHPQGWISSAFYIAVPDQATMGPEQAGWLQVGRPPDDLAVDLPPYRTVEPRPGRLVLFPSTMWHGTNPIAGGERLTIAFDIAPARTARRSSFTRR